MINKNVINILKENVWSLATCLNGEPNVVPVAFKDVTEDNKLIIGDVFLETTLFNLVNNNGKIAISAYNAETLEGYQIKGVGNYITTGPIVELFKTIVSKKSNNKLTIKGALVVTPEKIIVTTPNSNNKKIIL